MRDAKTLRQCAFIITSGLQVLDRAHTHRQRTTWSACSRLNGLWMHPFYAGSTSVLPSCLVKRLLRTLTCSCSRRTTELIRLQASRDVFQYCTFIEPTGCIALTRSVNQVAARPTLQRWWNLLCHREFANNMKSYGFKEVAGGVKAVSF